MVKQNKFQLQFIEHQKAISRSAIIICLYGISIFLPVVGGYTAYPIAIARCGRLPIITSDFMAGYDYSEPGMVSYNGPNWLSGNKNYVCTAEDAEKQGYRKAPW